MQRSSYWSLSAPQYPWRNRALYWGESVFTSLPIYQGRPLLLQAHLSRLVRHVHLLWEIPLKDLEHWSYLLHQQVELFTRSVNQAMKLRLTVTSCDFEALKTFEQLIVFMDSSHWSPPWECNISSLELQLECIRAEDSNQKFPAIKLGQYAKEFWFKNKKISPATGQRDLLFASTQGEVFDSTVASLLVKMDNGWFTPMSGQWVLDSIGLEIARESLLQIGEKVDYKKIFISDFSQIQSVVLVNALKGPVAVEKIITKDKSYFFSQFKQLDLWRKVFWDKVMSHE